jgi:hypothetical protein
VTAQSLDATAGELDQLLTRLTRLLLRHSAEAPSSCAKRAGRPNAGTFGAALALAAAAGLLERSPARPALIVPILGGSSP